jgi:hypothetical protein
MPPRPASPSIEPRWALEEAACEMESVEVRVKGHIEPDWSEWLEGLSITHADSGETIISGHHLDQSALYGILCRLFKLGIELVSVSAKEVSIIEEEQHRTKR